NGWNDELVKALHTFEANGTDGCLITHVGVHPDRYDEGVFQRRCLNFGAANYHYLVGYVAAALRQVSLPSGL
ncbi:hypothetical protein EV363DRAFT_1160737, partial [Boletus edulis]